MGHHYDVHAYKFEGQLSGSGADETYFIARQQAPDRSSSRDLFTSGLGMYTALMFSSEWGRTSRQCLTVLAT